MATKKELIKKLPKYIILGHGQYDMNPGYIVVPANTVFIFLSKASRFLPQSIVTNEFYDYFGNNKRNYSSIDTRNMPDIVKGWSVRAYGPGQSMADIKLSFNDPMWPGMGLHKLPIRPNQFKTNSGKFKGEKGTLSQLLPHIESGVYFIMTCRALPDQSKRNFMNIYKDYVFLSGTPHRNREMEDDISKSLFKRKATNSLSPQPRRTSRMRLTNSPLRKLRHPRPPRSLLSAAVGSPQRRNFL